jgi:hypothetical protein
MQLLKSHIKYEFLYYLNLQMKTLLFFETLEAVYQLTQHNLSEELSLLGYLHVYFGLCKIYM